MKCPKCGYLGFETSDRCRNCGYDFSLSSAVEPAPELPLRAGSGAAVPLADLQLGPAPDAQSRNTPSLDLDRLIGVTPDSEATAVAKTPRAVRDTPVLPPRVAKEPSRVEPAGPPVSESPAKDELPLFPPLGSVGDDTPLITTPRPVRPPLAVRRATPDVPRGRSRTRVTPPRHEEGSLQLDAPGAAESAIQTEAVEGGAPQPAATDVRSSGVAPRIFAMAIDAVLLAIIDAGVLYFTLAIAGLSFAEVRLLPPIPLVAFLLILDGGYLIAFTTAGGQTIGKMLTGVRVMGDDGRRVDTAGAVLRAFGCLLTLVTLGIGYLPVFVSADGRALHDRIAGTRVVKGDES